MLNHANGQRNIPGNRRLLSNRTSIELVIFLEQSAGKNLHHLFRSLLFINLALRTTRVLQNRRTDCFCHHNLSVFVIASENSSSYSLSRFFQKRIKQYSTKYSRRPPAVLNQKQSIHFARSFHEYKRQRFAVSSPELSKNKPILIRKPIPQKAEYKRLEPIPMEEKRLVKGSSKKIEHFDGSYVEH